MPLSQRCLDYCLKYNITTQEAFDENQEEAREFLCIPEVVKINCFNFVINSLRNKKFEDMLHITLHMDEWRKIEELLIYQGFHQKKDRMQFGLDLLSVLDKKTNKKNCFWIKGPNDTGKSGLIRQLAEKYFKHTYGQPVNYSQFPFNDCLQKRILLWEEANIGDKVIDECKNVFGGQPCFINVKYKSACRMSRTPVLITSNFDLWRHSYQDRGPMLARCYYYEFNRKIPTREVAKLFFPLKRHDFDVFFSDVMMYFEMGFFDPNNWNIDEILK